MTEITVNGPGEVAARLRSLAENYPSEASDAVWLELSKVMTESLRLCPVDTGYLRGSWSLPDPTVSDGRIEATIGYAAKYAWWVHEILDNYHKPPTQAKYLEQPLMKALPTIQDRIVKRVLWLLKHGAAPRATVEETLAKLSKPPEK